MKKILSGLMLITALLFSASLCAFAQDSCTLSPTVWFNGVLENSFLLRTRITNQNPDVRTGTLCVSTYSADNKLLSVQTLDTGWPTNSYQDIFLLVSYPANVRPAQLKMFLWDSLENMVTLAAPFSFRVSNLLPGPVPSVPVYDAVGMITDTYRTKSDFGETDATFQFSETFTAGDLVIPADTTYNITLKNMDWAADIGLPLQAKIQVDADNNLTLIGYNIADHVTNVHHPANLVDNYDGTGVYIYPSQDATEPTEYVLATDAKFYVNGVPVTLNDSNFATYVLHNPAQNLILSDVGIDDGKYHALYIDYYMTARLLGVSTDLNKMHFSDGDIALAITLADAIVHCSLDGEEITVNNLSQDTVLSIQYNVTGQPNYSNFYLIRADGKAVQGVLQSIHMNDEYIQLGENVYTVILTGFDSFADWCDYHRYDFALGDECLAYLSAFGQIFSLETAPDPVYYGIVDEIIENPDTGAYSALVYLADGSTKTYALDLSSSMTQRMILIVYGSSGIDNSDKRAITARVIMFTQNEDGDTITGFSHLPGGTFADTVYNKESASINEIIMNQDTVVIDATRYVETEDRSDLHAGSLQNLYNGMRYRIYAYRHPDSWFTAPYPFVIVLPSDEIYFANNRFSVVASVREADNVKTLEVLGPEDGNEIDLTLAEDVTIYNAEELGKGDLILYVQNNDGIVERVDVLFRGSQYINDYDALSAAILQSGQHTELLSLPNQSTEWTTSWDPESDKRIQLVCGPIVSTLGSNTFQLGGIQNGTIASGSYTGLYTDLMSPTDICDIIINPGNTRAYVFDYSASSRNNLNVDYTSAIQEGYIPNSDYLSDGRYIPWDNQTEEWLINFAVVTVVDGYAQDVFVLLEDG